MTFQEWWKDNGFLVGDRELYLYAKRAWEASREQALKEASQLLDKQWEMRTEKELK